MKRLMCVAIAMGLGACSTIVEGTTQTVSVNSTPQGAACTLDRENATIAQVANTPSGVVVEKTKHDITVTCSKPGYDDGVGYLQSGTEAATFGNIIAGGLIGWGIDSASGADNKYPEFINVPLAPASSADGDAPAAAAEDQERAEDAS